MYICLCGDVTEEEITDYVIANPNATVSEVTENLGMAIGCKRCLDELDGIIRMAREI